MKRGRRRIATGTCVSTVTASLLVSAGVFAGVGAGATGRASAEERGHGEVALGAYVDYGSAGPRRMAELSRWLGGTDLKVGHTYLPGDVWGGIEGNVDFLDDWARWRQGAKDRMFVLNVPMLERNEGRLPDHEVRGLLRAGAGGQFDHHFRALAQRLVDLGVPDTVVVLGWEMNGTTYAHRCGPNPAAWKAYWQRIVAAMRSVSGQSFRFDFAPNRGKDAIPWTECYPGDDVVDIIGMDSYDQAPGRTFEEQATAPYGLRDQVAFAREHGKEISYPEWGLFRNGDNPEYMRGMLDWIEEHEPLYQTITDYCPHGVWQCDDNPKSSGVFRSKLSGKPTVPTAPPVPSVPPVPSPKPAEPSATPSPSPMPPTPTPTPTPSEPVVPPPVVKPTPKPEEPSAPPSPLPRPNATEWCVPLPFTEWPLLWHSDKFCVKLPRGGM